MILALEDVLLAARTVWAEARGEPYQGKLAVAHVLKNRWLSKTGQWAKDDTLATACLRHAQFSCWTPGDPNFVPMQAVGMESPTFRECLRAVLEAIDAKQDPTFGSRHYKVTGIYADWAAGKSPIVRIGAHEFFCDIA